MCRGARFKAGLVMVIPPGVVVLERGRAGESEGENGDFIGGGGAARRQMQAGRQG